MANSEENKQGPDTEPIHVATRVERREQIYALFDSAERQISVLSTILDDYTFNSSRIEQSLSQFVIRHQDNRVNFLVENDRQVIQYNERLIRAARRFSSYINFRHLKAERDNATVSFIVIDDKHYLFQRDYSNPECIVAMNMRKEARHYQKQFDEIWRASPPMPGLHTLGL